MASFSEFGNLAYISGQNALRSSFIVASRLRSHGVGRYVILQVYYGNTGVVTRDAKAVVDSVLDPKIDKTPRTLSVLATQSIRAHVGSNLKHKK